MIDDSKKNKVPIFSFIWDKYIYYENELFLYPLIGQGRFDRQNGIEYTYALQIDLFQEDLGAKYSHLCRAGKNDFGGSDQICIDEKWLLVEKGSTSMGRYCIWHQF